MPRAPLKQVLDARIDEPRIHRVWQRVARGPQARASRPRWERWALASPVALAAVALAVWMTLPAPPRFLALADGGAPTAVEASHTTTITYADESEIVLDPDTMLVPTRNDETHFELTLARGRARFSVTPGGPRRWAIACGLATVVVVGTELTIVRDEGALRVSVQHGVVLVEALDGAHRLTAGEEIVLHAPSAPVAVAQPTDLPVEPVAPGVVGAPPSSETPTATTHADLATRASPRWADLANEGAYAQAYEALGPNGATGRIDAASPSELLLLADVARLSGHPDDAVQPLETLMRAHAEDSNAVLGAIMLGRLEQDTLHHPDRALRALDRAVELGVPAPLAIDVQSRHALAMLDAGDPRGPEAARAYLSAHPTGPRAAALRARVE
ncbi:MAG: FecR domain-containing protein [Sandaracinus sp.]